MSLLMKGVMVDTETLSLADNAMIWEAAALRFELHREGEAVKPVVTDHFDVVVDYDGMDTSDLSINLGTISWTDKLRGRDENWAQWQMKYLLGVGGDLPPHVESLKPAQLLHRIATMADGDPIWFRNNAFDPPRLEFLAKKACVALPWHRRQQSDLYTLINVAKATRGYVDTQPAQALHGAWSDANQQLQQLAKLAEVLNFSPAPQAEAGPQPF